MYNVPQNTQNENDFTKSIINFDVVHIRGI